MKSVIWTTYKKFIEDEKIPKALTKKLNEEFEKKFGKPVKNCIDYYYGVSIIERKKYEDKTVSFSDGKQHSKNKVNYDEPREDNGLDYGLDM